MPRAFLSAQWRWLAMLNWRVDPSLLRPLVPRGTELDTWHGAHYVSAVGFLFLDTRVLGVPVPMHVNFEELNLRFYVWRDVEGVRRRGVTFIKELVPRHAIAWVARLAYNEPYARRAMRHRISGKPTNQAPDAVEYGWRERGGWGRLSLEPTGESRALAEGSEAEFITEHYWGYTRQRDGGTMEYEVRHARWRTWRARRASLEGDLVSLYGAAFASALAREPDSAFLADGSPVSVFRPSRLNA
jgi:uncharacterized protein YqjF (DUF2071 family)